MSRWKILIRRDGSCELWSRGVIVAVEPSVITLFSVVANTQQAVAA